MSRLSRRERDIITLLNVLWYRDFPLAADRPKSRVRAIYTAHLNSIVKACADLMGFFVLYEHGGRTDAIIQTASNETIAAFEFEWRQPLSKDFNEVQKLSKAAMASDEIIHVFIGYSENHEYDRNIAKIRRQWKASGRHLIMVLITYDWLEQRRKFDKIETHIVTPGKSRKIRSANALPWQVEDTRWKLIRERPEST